MMNNFDPQVVLNLCKEINDCNWALKAFGALLESADFGKFFCKNICSADYQAGLNLIISIFVDHQEEKLRTLSEMAANQLESTCRKEFRAIDLKNQAKKKRP